MDTLTILLNKLQEIADNPVISQLIRALGEGSIDFSNLFSSDFFKNLAPVFKNFFSQSENKNPTDTNSVGNFSDLSPITPFADREIVNALNAYLGS